MAADTSKRKRTNLWKERGPVQATRLRRMLPSAPDEPNVVHAGWGDAADAADAADAGDAAARPRCTLAPSQSQEVKPNVANNNWVVT